jgi:hypothetical protein
LVAREQGQFIYFDIKLAQRVAGKVNEQLRGVE